MSTFSVYIKLFIIYEYLRLYTYCEILYKNIFIINITLYSVRGCLFLTLYIFMNCMSLIQKNNIYTM